MNNTQQLDNHNQEIFEDAGSQLIVMRAPTPLYEQRQKTPNQDYRQFLEAPTIDQTKRYSLDHDIRMGWVPKTQIAGPIPLTFQNSTVDSMLETTLQYSLGSVIYLGWRPNNTFQVHEAYCEAGKNYPFLQFHLCKSTFLSNFVKKYYPEYNFNRKRQFTGMNPALPPNPDLTFDSHYEGGNLDAVLLNAKKQYDMFIRVDSNTRGHCNYYCFRVRCHQTGTYRFNIANLSTKRTLYERGMRPFARSLKNPKSIWQQVGKNVRYSSREYKGKYNDERVQEINQSNCLSFDYDFKAQDEIQFCYCIPYTYTKMLKDISELEIDSRSMVHRTRLSFSLSGVEIPLLTITNQSKDQMKKYCIVISSRIHPGETNGSHVTLGLLKYLVSQEAKQLRDNVVFKVIPMLNPDGVILGNHRTGVSGKDLNREFMTNNKVIFPQVMALKEYMTDLKSRFGTKLLSFFDIHGHSMRKNAFFYGPQYPIFELGYMRSRILPRLMAQKTNMFRFYSCRFSIDNDKEKTARSVFLRDLRIDLCYTLESSNHCYFDSQTRQQSEFNEKSWMEIGKILGQSINDLITIELEKDRYRQRVLQGTQVQVHMPRQRGSEGKKSDVDIYRKILHGKFKKEFPEEIVTLKKKKLSKLNHSTQLVQKSTQLTLPSFKATSVGLIKMEDREEQFQKQIVLNQSQEKQDKEQDESDGYSEHGADSEPEDHDLSKNQLKIFYNKVTENKEKFYGEMAKLNKEREEKPKVKRKKIKMAETQKILSHDSQKLESKPSNILPPRFVDTRLHQPKQCTRKACKCKRYVDFYDMQHVKLEILKEPERYSTPFIEQKIDHFMSVRENQRKTREIQSKTPLIRIDQETLKRLVQNTNLNIIHKPLAQEVLRSSCQATLNHPILRRKKSIKSLQARNKQKQVFKTLETVLTNTKSLPRIVVMNN